MGVQYKKKKRGARGVRETRKKRGANFEGGVSLPLTSFNGLALKGIMLHRPEGVRSINQPDHSKHLKLLLQIFIIPLIYTGWVRSGLVILRVCLTDKVTTDITSKPWILSLEQSKKKCVHLSDILLMID